MLFKKLWRTMGLYKAQFISMIIMIALGTGMFVGFNMEWVSIKENTQNFFSDSDFADYRIMSDEGFSEDDAENVSNIDGIDEVSRFLSVNADVKEYDGDSVTLTVTENENVSHFVLIDGEEYDKDSKDGIWISDKYAENNGIKVGDELTLSYKTFDFTGKVKGLIKSGEYLICVRDKTQIMPDYSTHGFAYISPKMYEDIIKMPFYPQLNVISDLEKSDFIDKVDDNFGKTMLILTKDENTSYSSAQGEAEEGQTMGSILPVLFLLIAVLTMVTTMHRLTAKEKTQIGTLKALGFKDKRIMLHYTSYALMIGLIGVALGFGLGYLIAWYMMNPNGAMGTYFDLPYWELPMPWFCVVVMIAIVLLLTFIGFLSVKKMLKGTAADALRPYSPKKMKPMLIEKTSLFHKLPFGTRWNMRDSMRHKSRTAMSLIGVIGCTVLVIGALGMNDTTKAFLNVFYEEGARYSSIINIAEDATDEQKNGLIDKYDGDYSGSVSIEYEGKASALSIYSVQNDYVRFPDADDNYVDLKDDGAYLCKRYERDYNLSAGDTITISPYGSDDEYSLKINGFVRSMSEGIIITPKYAEKLGIPYSTDTIYTKTEKADIDSDNAIKSVQSKQMIMESFDSFMSILNVSVILLIAGAVILGIVVLYNLGVMSYTERYREMATLKVIGFRDKRIGNLMTGQNLWVTLIGVMIGIPLGVWTLDYLINALASEYEMKLALSPLTFILTAAMTFGVSLLVSFMVARKNKKIDMVEALKGAE
ncbi:MAG: FtsX-like permease family protein [Clostridia bacterium]|nr:FtsX-like permease family protein [Clostridia bacterium]